MAKPCCADTGNHGTYAASGGRTAIYCKRCGAPVAPAKKTGGTR